MGVYLALDAGGTKTECVVADEERVLARVVGATVKIMNVGAPEATARLRALLTNASDVAGVPLYLVNRTCMGLAGISSEGVRGWAEATLRDLLPGELLLTGDEEIALEAAFGKGPGILVISGTGSHVVARCASGVRMTAGGWGPMLGDEGSGYWIGLEAIRSGLRAIDRGVPTGLLRAINAFWQVGSVSGLISKANSRPRPDFAVLAEVVGRCAAEGDTLAMSVLERAGEELAAQVSVVISKMRASGCAPADMERVAYTGSVISHLLPVREIFEKTLKLTHPRLSLEPRPTEPIEGALIRARLG